MHTETPITLAEAMRQDILSRVIIPADNQPRVIQIWGPCRTATGALITTVSRADAVATKHIQPLKAFARKFVQATTGDAPVTPLAFLKDTLQFTPGSHAETHKETFGPDPHSPAEFLDPISLLLQKGLQPEKLVVIPTTRDPLEVAHSWARMWQWNLDNFPFDGFNHSFRHTLNLIQLAQSLGIKVVPYIHDATKDLGTTATIGQLFHNLGLAFHPGITRWNGEDAYFAKAVKYDQPPNQWISGARDQAHGGRGGFTWEPVPPHFSPEEEQIVLANIAESLDIHSQIVDLAHQTLGI